MRAPAPLRLALVTHSLSGGGAERFAVTLCRHLDRERFSPELLAATAKRGYAVPPDVAVTSLGYRSLAQLPRVWWVLRRRLHRLRPDLILSNVLSTSCLVGAALLGWSEAPAWVARVGLAPEAEPSLQQAWSHRVYPRARRLVANSEELAVALRRRYPALASRVSHIPNPVDIAGLRAKADLPPPEGPRAGRPTLVAVGRLVTQKRPDLLLTTLAEVRQAHPGARLWVCGDGPLVGALRRQAAELGLGDAVDWLGFVANPFPLVRRADLFLLTSDFEGLPNALIEAQALGVPAVATRCPYGPAEIVQDGVTGRLVPPGDGEAVAAAALDLLADEAARRGYGKAAAGAARQRYDISRVVPPWEELLEHAARGGA